MVYQGGRMKQKSIYIISLILLTSALVIEQAAAMDAPSENYTVCTGEYEKLCPETPPHDAWFPCGISPEDAGRSVCKVYTEKGQQIKPFRVLRLYVESGNRCGYAVFQVMCLGQ
jgi:hypothetical protein